MPAPGTDAGSILRGDSVAAALGPIEDWSAELRHCSVCLLESDQPMFLVWGSHLTVLFNEAYRMAMGFQNFSMLGVALPKLCGDLWPGVEPFVRDAFSGGSGKLHDREFEVTNVEKAGRPRFNVNYSPIRGAGGAEVVGVQCALTEARPFTPPVRQALQLTPRQRDCLSWVRAGKSSADIAKILGISIYTVDEHIAAARAKLGVRTRVQAAVEASLDGVLR